VRGGCFFHGIEVLSFSFLVGFYCFVKWILGSLVVGCWGLACLVFFVLIVFWVLFFGVFVLAF